ncbi:Uncharacterized protein Adt_33284 [Abeliophyllum distichum]|uniref:Uncharacterized protein n=1 Tax=Abeliophyllum distichum TaxID=126358 RepID=A0ABD1QVT4_9LAMI
MAQSNSKSKENLKLPEITELNDTARKGKVLCFPKTIVKYHSQTNATGELKLTIHRTILAPILCTEHFVRFGVQDTNTFITTNGEIGISLWDIREITGLSIRGDYYEEVVPSLSELSNLLPQSCLHLFKAYSLIVDKKKIDRIRHADWIEFWFQEDDCVPNPRKSKPFKKAMESKPRKEGQRDSKRQDTKTRCHRQA